MQRSNVGTTPELRGRLQPVPLDGELGRGGRNMELCMWCGKTAIRYCDAVIGFEATGATRDKDGSVTGLLTGLDGRQWTCDAPMCADHARQVGHVCGEDPDSIDHCPHCTAHSERQMKDMVMFAGEAEARRREVHAEIRRERMRNERYNAALTGGEAVRVEGIVMQQKGEQDV